MKSVTTALQAILPQHLLSRVAGALASLERPLWLKNYLIRIFICYYNIDLSEAKCSEVEDFRHFNAFFTRALKEKARPLSMTKWCQPADGILSQRGFVQQGNIIQAKGRSYNVGELLAGPDAEAVRYANGCFSTTYLSPRDYHRVHMPIDGRLVKTRYVPGDLFSVNAATVDCVEGLFARNERLVCFFETDYGGVVMVLVGAMIVAGIATVWGGREFPDAGDIRESNWLLEQSKHLEKGAEMGQFFLGSTVVLVTEVSDLQWSNAVGDFVRVRGPLAN